MNAPTAAAHPCNPDPFAVCECGRAGHGTFGPNVRLRTAEIIEATFEFVEALRPDQTFTVPQLVGALGSYAIGPKTVRLMEHLGYVCRVGRAESSGRPVRWQRADDPAAASR